MKMYVFAFSADEMPVFDPTLMVHQLNVNEDMRPVKQKKRNFFRKRMRLSRKRFINC